MKIPIWLIVVLLLVGPLAFMKCKKTPIQQVHSISPYIDSLLEVTEQMQKSYDSLDRIVQHRDTVINKQIKNVKTSAEGVYRLPSDSSYKLFIQWAAMFRDSSARARYLQTDSTGLYQ